MCAPRGPTWRCWHAWGWRAAREKSRETEWVLLGTMEEEKQKERPLRLATLSTSDAAPRKASVLPLGPHVERGSRPREPRRAPRRRFASRRPRLRAPLRLRLRRACQSETCSPSYHQRTGQVRLVRCLSDFAFLEAEGGASRLLLPSALLPPRGASHDAVCAALRGTQRSRDSEKGGIKCVALRATRGGHRRVVEEVNDIRAMPRL
jgi:hypothetical protein